MLLGLNLVLNCMFCVLIIKFFKVYLVKINSINVLNFLWIFLGSLGEKLIVFFLYKRLKFKWFLERNCKYLM